LGATSHPASEVAPVLVDWGPARPQQPDPGPKPFRLTDAGFELSIPGLCDFLISPTRIAISPVPGVDEQSIRTYLLGSAIGALLHLHGLTVFHGSAVLLPDGTAAMFCGLSTAGKSTLAATLAGRRHAALADDVTAVRMGDDGRPWCLPGLARTKLWRDALEGLGLAAYANASTQVLPDMDKYCLPIKTAAQPALLSRFYELQVDESSQEPLKFIEIKGVDKLHVMLSNIYRAGYLKAMGRQNHLLTATSQMAKSLAVHRISRPRQGHTLPAIVNWLEAQWG
jgi:hypothetical protein